MTKRKCAVPGCPNPQRARNWCGKHWQRWRKYGTPDDPSLVPIPDLPGERWLAAVSHTGLYEVSDRSRVRSVGRIVPFGSGQRLIPGRVITQHLNRDGYMQVRLWRDGKLKWHKVHRLVAEAFLGPCPDGMEVRHGPNGPLDNRASQLCYGTPRDNSLDRERDGTDLRGARIAQAKLTDDIVRQCRARYAAGGVLLRTLADEHGVAMGTMSFAIRGITWRHVA